MAARRIFLRVWDGYVEAIDDDGTFTAVLQDNKLREGELELATFPVSMLTPYDRKRLELGSYVRFEIYRDSNRVVGSKVWLRRWRWTRRELERADRKAKKFSELFNDAPKL